MGKWVHKLSDIDQKTETATCANCGRVRVRWKPSQELWQCREAIRASHKKYRKPYKYSYTYKYQKLSHGLTPAEAKEFKRGKLCEICGSATNLCVDHCHATGKIRGVLCMLCNTSLGAFGDSVSGLERALDYLKRSAT